MPLVEQPEQFPCAVPSGPVEDRLQTPVSDLDCALTRQRVNFGEKAAPIPPGKAQCVLSCS